MIGCDSWKCKAGVERMIWIVWRLARSCFISTIAHLSTGCIGTFEGKVSMDDRLWGPFT